MASVTLFALPVQAQSPTSSITANYTGGPLPAGVTPDLSLDTIPYLSISPNPIGVGEQLLVNLWVQPALQVNRAHTGYTVTFTKPDGTTTTVGPMNSYCGDTTAWFEYVVDQVGTWKVKFNFAGDYYPAGYYYNGRYPSLAAIGPYTVSAFGGPILLGSAYYKPSSTADVDTHSAIRTSDVLAPICAPNRLLDTPSIRNEQTVGFNRRRLPVYRPHEELTPRNQLLRQQLQVHPLCSSAEQCTHSMANDKGHSRHHGRRLGSKVLWSGEGGYAGTPSIIFEGRCYQTVTKSVQTLINGTYYDQPTSVWECYDLRTGQVYWEQTGIAPHPQPLHTSKRRSRARRKPITGRHGREPCGDKRRKTDKVQPIHRSRNLNISIAPITSGTIYSDPYVLSVQTLGSGASTNIV